MNEDIDMKELEKKAWKSTFQDGLWDIMLGLVFFVPAVTGLFIENDYAMIPLYFAAILLFVTAKKRITIPRIGFVRFGEQRRKKGYLVALILTASVIILTLMVVLKKTGLLSAGERMPVGPFIVGLNIIVVFGFMAYYLNFNRLYIYAVLIGVVEPLTAVLEMMNLIDGPYLMLLVISSGMIVTGVILLARFIQHDPIPSEEA